LEPAADFRKNWKRQLFVVWMAQFIAANGFSFGLPFAPFFMQKDLLVPSSSLPVYVALFGASAPLTMMLFAPIWGALADKFGRRKMLLRSYIGGAVAIGLMGVATEPVFLIFLRLVQGMFCGTVSAAQTLISTQTPEEHNGFALGSLHSAMFSGHMTGSFLGGLFAEYFGYRNAFFATAGLMTTSFILVLYGVREHFVPQNTRMRNFFSTLVTIHEKILLK
jgi:DHA1 family multidrug resistance protein-like MFS transporter